MAHASAPPQDDRIGVRLNSELKKKIQLAAELEGVSLSDFVTRSALERASDVILRNTRVELSLHDPEALARELLSPSDPPAALVEAFRFHAEDFGSR